MLSDGECKTFQSTSAIGPHVTFARLCPTLQNAAPIAFHDLLCAFYSYKKAVCRVIKFALDWWKMRVSGTTTPEPLFVRTGHETSRRHCLHSQPFIFNIPVVLSLTHLLY